LVLAVWGIFTGWGLVRWIGAGYVAREWESSLRQETFQPYVVGPRAQDRREWLSMCLNTDRVRVQTTYAVVSVLRTDGGNVDRYMDGARKIGRAVKRFAKIDTVMLMFSDEESRADIHTRSQLDARARLFGGWTPCHVDAIQGPVWAEVAGNPYLENKAYSKLHIFRMVEYQAVLFVDLDTVIVRQFSGVFQIELPAMIAAGQVVAMGRNTHPNGSDFNAGVMLVRPAQTEFERVVSSISKVPHNVETAEQSLLNHVYAGAIHVLPFRYNAMVSVKTGVPAVWADGRDLAILHYTCKPWNWNNCWRDGIEDLCQLWYLVEETKSI
jgi:lipopolysaccharide biosynthesis glycosyltransferase